MSRFFKGVAVILTVIAAILIILTAVHLVWQSLDYSSSPNTIYIPPASYVLQYYILVLLIASAVEIALFWLLVFLDIISRRHGIIASLVLVILVGIVILISMIVTF
ncbi:MAG: hypothetical protein AB1589_01525 [Cyanobacteriota bacterium]